MTGYDTQGMAVRKTNDENLLSGAQRSDCTTELGFKVSETEDYASVASNAGHSGIPDLWEADGYQYSTKY